ncbi:MAG TPA: GWxTD domain-containing protein [Candidatus Aminicenantes bacterium]|nr:GWxTD domain-containing protein [Candidatus Aminicenantes bacterium]
MPNRGSRGAVPALAFLAFLAVPAAFGAPAGAEKLDPESAKFFQTARLIMSKEELKIWNRLPDAPSRREFIDDFWLKRDPDPDTPLNEYKREFDARVEYAAKRFKEGIPGYNTDRGRIYIFMGPPDKVEEFPPQPGLPVRGFVVWWSYYDDRMAVEFTDEKGNGQYKITQYAGDFFGAMDIVKLGRNIRADDVFSRKFFKFETVYDRAARELEVRIPAKSLMFRENDEGRLQIDLVFVFYIYPDEGQGKESFREARSVVLTDAELEARKTVDFRFARGLKPGTSYVDVIVQAPEGMKGKIRQIFAVKVAK